MTEKELIQLCKDLNCDWGKIKEVISSNKEKNKMVKMIKKIINKIRRKVDNIRATKYIEKNKFNLIRGCYKNELDDCTEYIRIVAVNSEENTLGAMYVQKPKVLTAEEDAIISTEKYGTYSVSMNDEMPPYMNIFISFVHMSIEELETCWTKISQEEFEIELSGTLDALYSLGTN